MLLSSACDLVVSVAPFFWWIGNFLLVLCNSLTEIDCFANVPSILPVSIRIFANIPVKDDVDTASCVIGCNGRKASKSLERGVAYWDDISGFGRNS
jgi:hypothetical protein